MSAHDFGEGRKLLDAVDGAEGVAGRIQNDPARSRAYRGGERVRPQLEPGSRFAGHDNRRSVRDPDHARIADPVGRRDHHFVPRIQSRQ